MREREREREEEGFKGYGGSFLNYVLILSQRLLRADAPVCFPLFCSLSHCLSAFVCLSVSLSVCLSVKVLSVYLCRKEWDGWFQNSNYLPRIRQAGIIGRLRSSRFRSVRSEERRVGK